MSISKRQYIFEGVGFVEGYENFLWTYEELAKKFYTPIEQGLARGAKTKGQTIARYGIEIDHGYRYFDVAKAYGASNEIELDEAKLRYFWQGNPHARPDYPVCYGRIDFIAIGSCDALGYIFAKSKEMQKAERDGLMLSVTSCEPYFPDVDHSVLDERLAQLEHWMQDIKPENDYIFQLYHEWSENEGTQLSLGI